nr:MAG TPA: hypothetical protein [Caudoviricetes sp.]
MIPSLIIKMFMEKMEESFLLRIYKQKIML